MKKLTILVALLLIGLSANSFAQQTATATASTTATIVTPIGISKTVDMNFGNIATSALVGTVILTPASGRSVTGGATLVGTASVSAASFSVTGSAAGSYTYAITLPGTITLAGTTAGVTVGTFTSLPSGTGTLTAGAQTVTVGATLNLPVSTVAGSYTNAAGLSVMVSYN